MFLGVVVGRADTIVSSGGAAYGFYSVGGSFPDYLGVSWSESVTYSKVTISAFIYTDPFNPNYRAGTAYLTTSIGPGTTPQVDQVAQTTFTVPPYSLTAQPFVVFSGLTLAPGTYYVLIGGPQNATEYYDWSASYSPVVNTGSGISNVHFLQALGNGVDPLYPPALPVGSPSETPLLTIATPVPEPASTGFVIVALVVIGFVLLRGVTAPRI
jgi:hypothetical protein